VANGLEQGRPARLTAKKETMSRVTLERLVKRYRQTEVVRGIDLNVEEGEFIVLLGPSGCGKTTTLRMIAGFTEPTSGAIYLGGEAVNALPPRARNIGMVFQDYALFPNMTVAENIGFGLTERSAPRERLAARTAEMLALIRMEEFAARYPAELSGGQQQRVALARALAYAPRVLLMDEPLGALDQKLREEMQREFARIQRTLAITTIFVTHDQQEAMALADRIVVMNSGLIEQVGPPEELYRDPKTLFIANFVGRSNNFAGMVEGREGDHSVVRLSTGERIMARNQAGVVAGQRVACVVRPERLAASSSKARTGMNTIAARLLRRSFFGSSVDLVLVGVDGAEIIVQISDGAPPDGEALVLTFAADDTLCFAAPP
jgi:spermidine/putrescine ABC transporter ATP-binding subunit